MRPPSAASLVGPLTASVACSTLPGLAASPTIPLLTSEKYIPSYLCGHRILLPLRFFLEKEELITATGWSFLLEHSVRAVHAVASPKRRAVHAGEILTGAVEWVLDRCPEVIEVYGTTRVGSEGSTATDGDPPAAALVLCQGITALTDAVHSLVKLRHVEDGGSGGSGDFDAAVLRAAVSALEGLAYLPSTMLFGDRPHQEVVSLLVTTVSASVPIQDLVVNGTVENTALAPSPIGLAMLTLAICPTADTAERLAWMPEIGSQTLFDVWVTRASHLLEVDCLYAAIRGCQLAAVGSSRFGPGITSLHPQPTSELLPKPAQPVAQAQVLHLVSCPSAEHRAVLSEGLGTYLAGLPDRLRHQQYVLTHSWRYGAPQFDSGLG